MNTSQKTKFQKNWKTGRTPQTSSRTEGEGGYLTEIVGFQINEKPGALQEINPKLIHSNWKDNQPLDSTKLWPDLSHYNPGLLVLLQFVCGLKTAIATVESFLVGFNSPILHYSCKMICSKAFKITSIKLRKSLGQRFRSQCKSGKLKEDFTLPKVTLFKNSLI